MAVIELVQGDVSKIFKFKRKFGNGEVITTIPQKMWITFKRSCTCEDCLFQKTLKDETIKYSSEDNYYRFQLLSEDTCDLSYGDYGFDIAILDEGGNKRTLLNDGVLKIKKHYTKNCNEV